MTPTPISDNAKGNNRESLNTLCVRSPKIHRDADDAQHRVDLAADEYREEQQRDIHCAEERLVERGTARGELTAAQIVMMPNRCSQKARSPPLQAQKGDQPVKLRRIEHTGRRGGTQVGFRAGDGKSRVRRKGTRYFVEERSKRVQTAAFWVTRTVSHTI
jgi:hypothetical protein